MLNATGGLFYSYRSFFVIYDLHNSNTSGLSISFSCSSTWFFFSMICLIRILLAYPSLSRALSLVFLWPVFSPNYISWVCPNQVGHLYLFIVVSLLEYFHEVLSVVDQYYKRVFANKLFMLSCLYSYFESLFIRSKFDLRVRVSFDRTPPTLFCSNGGDQALLYSYQQSFESSVASFFNESTFASSNPRYIFLFLARPSSRI